MSGDPLAVLEQALRGCEPAVMGDAAARIERAGLERIDKGFRQGIDMQGKKFLPPQHNAYRYGPPMIRSGALRAGYETATSSEVAQRGSAISITFRNVMPYADYLRDGTSKMEPRQHMPRPGEAPPPDLDAAWTRACAAAHERYWSRVRL